MMTEAGYVEQPILEWLAGQADDSEQPGLGWTYRDQKAMEAFERPLTDPLTEALLVPAILRINPAIQTEGQARKAVEALRRALNAPDLLEANRRTLDLLRDGVPIVLESGQSATTVKFIEFDPVLQHLNDFTVTNQYEVKGAKTCRADTVLLVNGIPLCIAEYKSFISSGHDWKEGMRQFHRYQNQAPALLASNVFCVAADEQDFRFGTVLFKHNAGQSEIDVHLDNWQPWESQYPVQRRYWNLPAEERDPDPVRAAVQGLLRPRNVLDFLEHFVVFETQRGQTTKKVARYQQFEAANDIVDRVLALIGKPLKPQDRTGLIWHYQGSGKTLTMLFAAYKLRRQPALQNPTVFCVVDRRNLKRQTHDEFVNCDYPSVVKALGVTDLKQRIATDARETVVTTLQCFQQMDDLVPLRRDNVILLIDEAHRSQKGKGQGYAMTMRVKLPDAFRFGFTGTPIDRTMINTHRDFGPVTEGYQERYLSYYGIRQAIKDNAILEVHYLYRKVPFLVKEKPLSLDYEQMCKEMEVEDEAEKDIIQRREARWKALAMDKRRVKKVVADLVEHFVAHPDPSGFKAQLVVVDRFACAAYKEALDQELQKRGLPPEWSDVIISHAQNDTEELTRFHYSEEDEEERIEYFKLTPAQWEKWNRDRFGDDSTQWKPPLKILIVCNRLLAGFDASIEQVMYLDKPLRDHDLLQAIARTNRPLPELGKRNGLVVDYFGVFEDLQKALNYDESVREEAVINWDKLREQVPTEIGKCLEFFAGINIEDTRACLMEALHRLLDKATAQNFETQFKRTETLWEALSPDDCLYPHRFEYAWLCGIYIAHRRRGRRALATREELAAKTRQLIQQHTRILDIAEAIPVYKIDANYLAKVEDLPTSADRAAELEAALARELIEGDTGIRYKHLGERVKNIIALKDASDTNAQKLYEELQSVVRAYNETEQEPNRLGLDDGEYALFTVIHAMAWLKDEALCVQAARTMMQQLREKQLLPSGWADNVGGRKKVSLNLHVAAWDYPTLQLCPEDDPDPLFLKTAVEELVRVLE